MIWTGGRRRAGEARPLVRPPRLGTASPVVVRRGPRVTPLVTPIVLGLLFVLVGCTPAGSPAGVKIASSSDPDHGYHGTVPPVAWPLPDETFTDTGGHDYNLATTPSRPVTLVFFGYTHCPDVCIGVLSDVATALSRVDPMVRNEVGVVYVTTDPARDTPQVIGSYLSRFDPDFVGLTGPMSRVSDAADALGVDLSGTQRLRGGGYLVSHSAQVIGFDKNGRAAVSWLPGTSIADLKADITLLAQRQR